MVVGNNQDETMNNEQVKLGESTGIADVHKVPWTDMVRNTSNQQGNTKGKQNPEKEY